MGRSRGSGDDPSAPIGQLQGVVDALRILLRNQPLPGQNALSLADVRRAFREVDFARPLVEPAAGRVALVSLDTYYAVTWPQEGVGPEQVADSEPVGRTVNPAQGRRVTSTT